MTADHTPKRLHVRCAPMVWWQEIMLVLATSHIRSKICSVVFLAFHHCCHMNSMEEEIVRFFSRFRETTSILREKLTFQYKTRFEKTC